MKKIVVPTKAEEPINKFLKNLLIISFSVFTGIGGSIFFMGKVQDRMNENEKDIITLKTEFVTFKESTYNTVLEINKLNLSLMDNKMFIYQNYNDDVNVDKLLKISDDNYYKELNRLISKIKK